MCKRPRENPAFSKWMAVDKLVVRVVLSVMLSGKRFDEELLRKVNTVNKLQGRKFFKV